MWFLSPFWKGFFTLFLIELLILFGAVVFAIIDDILRSPNRDDKLENMIWTFVRHGKLIWRGRKK